MPTTTSQGNYNPLGTLEPLVEVLPIDRAADDLNLIKLRAACARNGVDDPVVFAKIIAAAGGLLLFVTGGGELFVNPAMFRSAVTTAKIAGAF